MSRIRVAPIVEGDGEIACVRILLERIRCELLGGQYVEVVKPIRAKRDLLVKTGEFEKSVRMASGKLGNPPGCSDPALVLILLDANEDCPGALGPNLLDRAGKKCPSDIDLACVFGEVRIRNLVRRRGGIAFRSSRSIG